MTLRRKIRWLTWFGLIGCLMAAIPALYLLRHGLIAERERMTGALVESSRTMLNDLDRQVAMGAIARDEAQARARLALRALAGDPFHLTVFADGPVPPGWPPIPHAVISQASFEPWGWVVAAAGDIDDIDREFAMEAATFVLFLLALLVLSWPISLYLSQNVVGPIEALSTRMRLLTEGRTEIDIPGRHRRDEFGAMARAMEYFRRSASALIERDERLAGIMNNVSEAIVLVDEHGRIEEHNPAAVALFGVAADALPGRALAGLFTESDRGRVQALLAGAGGAGDSGSHAGGAGRSGGVR